MASKFTPGTLPDHEWCTVHRHYKLGCEQYERLLTRSGQCCEICRLPSAENPRGKLHIDHYGPVCAVRGLLCNTCNTRLTAKTIKVRATWAADYLDNSWWIKECERVGVPIALVPEPDYGSAIRDQFGVMWMREGDGLWRPIGRGKPGISSATWQWLYDQRGPQNMALLDLDTESERDSWHWRSAEKAMLQALIAESCPDFSPSTYRGTVAHYLEKVAALWPVSGASSPSCAHR